MGMYGAGLTFEQVCNLDKEQVRHALMKEPEIAVGEDEHGFIYRKCTKEEADAVVLTIMDGLVFQGVESMHSARALESIMGKHGIKASMPEYFAALDETQVLPEYEYEGAKEARTEALATVLAYFLEAVKAR